MSLPKRQKYTGFAVFSSSKLFSPLVLFSSEPPSFPLIQFILYAIPLSTCTPPPLSPKHPDDVNHPQQSRVHFVLNGALEIMDKKDGKPILPRFPLLTALFRAELSTLYVNNAWRNFRGMFFPWRTSRVGRAMHSLTFLVNYSYTTSEILFCRRY